MSKSLRFLFCFTCASLYLISLTSFNLARADAGASHILMDSPHHGESGWDISLGPAFYVVGNEFVVGMEDADAIGPALLSDISYQNNNFYFFFNSTGGIAAGYSLYKNKDWIIDVVAGPKFGLPENDKLKTIEERQFDFHGGIKLYHYGENNLFAVEVSQDISGAHDGALLSAEYLHEFQIKNWVLTLGAAIAFISEDMIDYYFGIDADEANSNFPVYQAGSSKALFGHLKLEYPINEKWIFASYLLTVKGDSTIKNSPITSSDFSSVLLTGVRYRF